MPLTEFVTIAVEGPTVDGRTIERQWIEDMAAGYDPETYTARINCEHLTGFSPQPPFNAYGDVAEVRAADVTLKINGKETKLRALQGRLDVNDQAIEINKAGQKVFSSCEIAPNFAGTGKAGLVGLALTDTPASLGTQKLQFSAKVRGAELTDPCEGTLKLSPESAPAPAQDSEATNLAKGIAAFFANFGKTKEEPAPPAPPPPPAPANDNGMAELAAQTGKLAGLVEQLSGKFDGFGTRLDAAEKAHADLTAKLEGTETRGQTKRPPATGGDSKFARAEC